MDELDDDSIDLEDCYVAISNYSKASLDELDLRVGQMVCVIDNSDPGEPTCARQTEASFKMLFLCCCRYLVCKHGGKGRMGAF